MAMAVNTMLRGIIDDIKYDVELARHCEDMTDPYYQGYVTALEYAEQHIVGKRLEYMGGNAEQNSTKENQMTSNNGAAGFTVRMQASQKDFERYFHSVGNNGIEKEASIIETSIAKRILDMCIKRCKLELQNEEDARCKALQTVAKSISAEWDEAGKELDKTTDTHDRATLIGRLQACTAMLNTVNNMLTPAFQVSVVKYGQGADNGD